MQRPSFGRGVLRRGGQADPYPPRLPGCWVHLVAARLAAGLGGAG